MNKTIKIKRGLKANLPDAGVVAGELKFTTDTKELFIGDGTDNILINKDVYTRTEVDNELALKANLAVSNVFTQPQQVPNATLPQHTVNKLQVETMFEMFKRELRGYNLFDGQLEQGGFISGIPAPANVRVRDVNFRSILGNTAYTYSSGDSIGGSLIRLSLINYYDVNYNFISQVEMDGLPLPQTHTTPINAVYQKNSYRKTDNTSVTVVDFNGKNIKIEKGTVATPYTVPGQIPQYKIVGEE